LVLKKKKSTLGLLKKSRRPLGKYNTIYHLISEHSLDGLFNPESTVLPKIPRVTMVNMFISQKGEGFLKISEAAPLNNRQTYTLPDSDGIEGIKEDMKKERAPTVSVVEPAEKRRWQ
jgi:hypothetical protein